MQKRHEPRRYNIKAFDRNIDIQKWQLDRAYLQQHYIGGRGDDKSHIHTEGNEDKMPPARSACGPVYSGEELFCGFDPLVEAFLMAFQETGNRPGFHKFRLSPSIQVHEFESQLSWPVVNQ